MLYRRHTIFGSSSVVGDLQEKGTIITIRAIDIHNYCDTRVIRSLDVVGAARQRTEGGGEARRIVFETI